MSDQKTKHITGLASLSPQASNPSGRLGSESLLALKTIVFFLLFLGASVFFGVIYGQISTNYLTIIFSASQFFSSILWVFTAIALMAITAGFTVMLARPFWLNIICFFVSAVIILFFIGVNTATMILVIIYFVFALLYSLSVKNKLENQIKFSIHPIADAQKILLIILAVMASSSVAFGYLNDAATRSFVIPPEVKTSVNKFIESKMDAGSEQVKIPEKDKKALAEKSKGEIEKMWTNLETRLKDGKNTIAIFLASAFFTILQLILIVFSFIPLLILRILFPLLKLIHVTRIVTETKEVEQLVL